jgi:hypothetical protein
MAYKNKNTPEPNRVIDLGFDCKIISLGNKCYSRTHPARFHLYDFKKTREVRMPFDGCITPYSELCAMLNTNFQNVFDGLKYDKHHKFITTKSAIYNHEKSSNLDNFREQMAKRISQFNEELRSTDMIVFFLTHDNFPDELISIIKENYPTLKFKIFCLNWHSNKPTKNDDFCKFISIEKPTKNYIEWQHRETSHGKMFEKKVLSEFLMFLSDLSGKTYDLESIFSLRSKEVPL